MLLRSVSYVFIGVGLAPLCTVVNGRYSRLVPIFLVPMSFINVSDVLICQFFNYSSHLFFLDTSNILESDFPVECSGLPLSHSK